MSDKVQKVTVGIGIVEANPGWLKSTLTFSAYRNDIQRVAVIEIREPYELRYIRERLDEIEAHWHKQLERLKDG